VLIETGIDPGSSFITNNGFSRFLRFDIQSYILKQLAIFHGKNLKTLKTVSCLISGEIPETHKDL
jgi:hypothetical protein